MDWTVLLRQPPVTLWWRDDDAGAWTPALARLLDLASRHAVPLAIAAVPTALDDKARARLPAAPGVTLLVHGYRHANHAPAAAKKAEFGAHRPLADMVAEVAEARRRLPRSLPVFVPPWNRIDPLLAAALPGIGFAGLSTHGDASFAVAALRQVNTTIDPIDWRDGRRFIGGEAVLGRISAAPPGRPIGLLTHHATMPEEMWQFLDTLLAESRRGGVAHWSSAGELFSISA